MVASIRIWCCVMLGSFPSNQREPIETCQAAALFPAVGTPAYRTNYTGSDASLSLWSSVSPFVMPEAEVGRGRTPTRGSPHLGAVPYGVGGVGLWTRLASSDTGLSRGDTVVSVAATGSAFIQPRVVSSWQFGCRPCPIGSRLDLRVSRLWRLFSCGSC